MIEVSGIDKRDRCNNGVWGKMNVQHDKFHQHSFLHHLVSFYLVSKEKRKAKIEEKIKNKNK